MPSSCKMRTFVAMIRRMPGGEFMKVPKSPAMTAVPVQTTLKNLATYFVPWPKRKSEFIMYGQRRSLATAAPLSHRIPGDSEGEHLYGPRASAGKDASAATGSCTGAGGGDSGIAKAGVALDAAAAAAAAARPLGLSGLTRRFQRGQKLVMVTAYDFPSARLARGAGVELVLVGDSLGNCRLGLPDTVGVTMDDMLRATTAVRRGVDAAPQNLAGAGPGPKPVVVGDMPFGSYLLEVDALRNAAAFRVAGADMVKLEGGRQLAPTVRALTNAGIAVMGHIGLEPQSAFIQGGLRLQGTTADAALELVRDALAIVEAGAKAVVVECVPVEVARAVQAAIPSVPVIGIGAGNQVAGQVLVCDDLLGVHGQPPSFVKMYADLAKVSSAAYAAYVEEVRSGAFPSAAHSRRMQPEEVKKLYALLPELGVAELSAEEPAEVSPPRVPPEAVAHESRQAPERAASAATGPARNGALQLCSPGIGSKPTSPGGAAPTLDMSSGWMLHQLAKANGARLAGARALSQARPSSSASEPGGMAGGSSRREVQVLPTREAVHAWRAQVGRVAFVPTMGNLHEGHLELVDEAKKHADHVLVSIFVNPSQFAPHEDLDRYPRTFQRDLELLRERGAAAVFAPTPEEMYPSGSPGRVVVTPLFVDGKSEAACRPFHFTGVATVCLKLFNLCQPDVVVFGQKDAMQCVVIARMLEDLMLDSRITLIVAPTSREADGVARSSRNAYLTPGMRSRAPAIYAALEQATKAPNATPGSVRRAVHEALAAAGMEASYVSVADRCEMNERADDDTLADSVVSVACLLEEGGQQCRLLDNVVVPAGSV